ncbi:DDE-type integrase/transposase/recombinase [Globicatella sanguinis]
MKCGNYAQAARRYHTSRQQISRWVSRYDGSWDSLRPKSRRPFNHPNQHTREELKLIQEKHQRYGHEGLAQVYVECVKQGYQRHYATMCKIIRKQGWNRRTEATVKSYPKSKWKPTEVRYLGEKVPIDIKYVPQSCIKWDSGDKRYYQITAIDEYSRKRVCKIVDEKSVTHTAQFLLDLEEKMGFKIKTVQTDNGREFTNDPLQAERESIFEAVLKNKGITYRKTRPYSPWQNGIVERSHREDSERFYQRQFNSEEELITAHQRYVNRGNNIHRKALQFKSLIEIIKAYKSNQDA